MKLIHQHPVQSLLVITWFFLASTTTAQAGTELGIVVQLCTDDKVEIVELIAKSANKQLTFCKVLPSQDCENLPDLSPKQTLLIGKFVQNDENGVSLQLTHQGGTGMRLRDVPWLDTLQHPLDVTLAQKRVTTLAILLDNLVLEFHQLELGDAPDPQPLDSEMEFPQLELGDAPDSQPLDSEMEASDAKASSVESVSGNKPQRTNNTQSPPKRPTKRNLFIHLIGVGGSFNYLTPSLAAPTIDIGYDLFINRFGAALRLAYEFDSSYKLKGRPFQTAAIVAAIGAKLLLFQNIRGIIGLDVGLLLRYSMFSRDDITNADTKRFFTVAVTVLVHARLRIWGPLGVFTKLGIAITPFPATLAIKDGPDEQFGLFGFNATAGFDLLF